MVRIQLTERRGRLYVQVGENKYKAGEFLLLLRAFGYVSKKRLLGRKRPEISSVGPFSCGMTFYREAIEEELYRLYAPCPIDLV